MVWASWSSLVDAFRRTPWDLNVDYLAARAYLNDFNPYTAKGAVRSGVAIAGLSGFGHPPTTAFWALPLTVFAIRPAGWILAAVTCLLLLVQIIVLVHELELPAPKQTTWIVFSFVATSSFMNYHFGVGQFSGLIGFLLFAGWWALRRQREVLAGVALGAACTLKLFPGVMVLFLVVTCRWRSVIGAVIVYLLIAAVMTLRFTVASWTTFFSVQPLIANQWMGSIQNQSIHGVLAHLFHPVCLAPGPMVHAALTISVGLSALLLFGAGLMTWQRRHDPGAFDLSYGLFIVLSVVTSQWAWEHYLIIYVTPAAILSAELRRRWLSGRDRLQTATMFLILVGIVLAWRVDVHWKQRLQRSVLAGNLADHFRLHVADVLNWAPGLFLMTLMFVMCWKLSVSRPEGPARQFLDGEFHLQAGDQYNRRPR